MIAINPETVNKTIDVIDQQNIKMYQMEHTIEYLITRNRYLENENDGLKKIISLINDK